MTKTLAQIEQVQVELDRALNLHGEFKSFHEGYAVILEEMDELWTEIKKPFAERSRVRIYEESKQLAAMAVKMMIFSDDPRNLALSSQKLPETPQRPATNTELKNGYDSLPWKENKIGVEWIFTNIQDKGADLLRALLKDKESVEVGGYVYSISGMDGKFINRKRVSK